MDWILEDFLNAPDQPPAFTPVCLLLSEADHEDPEQFFFPGVSLDDFQEVCRGLSPEKEVWVSKTPNASQSQRPSAAQCHNLHPGGPEAGP